MWMLDFQIMKKYLVSILLCLSFTSLASSLEDNYNAAQAAYEKGDFNKAGDLFAKVANVVVPAYVSGSAVQPLS